MARRSAGARSHAAQLAGALLGEILYELDELDTATMLLDESGELGTEGGIVEFMFARFAVAARVMALRGDRDTVAQRLDWGAQCADANALPRLRARIDYERTVLGFAPDTDPVGYATRRRPHNGIEEATAQLEDARAIIETIADPKPDRLDLACRWAREWVEHLESSGRELALLHAQRLLAGALAVSDRTDEGDGADGQIGHPLRRAGHGSLPGRRTALDRCARAATARGRGFVLVRRLGPGRETVAAVRLTPHRAAMAWADHPVRGTPT